MADPCILTLGNKTAVFDISEIIARLIQFYATTPKNAYSTDVFFRNTVSLRDTLSQRALVDKGFTQDTISTELTQALTRILTADLDNPDPTTIISVNTSITDIDETRYGIVIDVKKDICYNKSNWSWTSRVFLNDYNCCSIYCISYWCLLRRKYG
jgi:hypothetical protein